MNPIVYSCYYFLGYKEKRFEPEEVIIMVLQKIFCSGNVSGTTSRSVVDNGVIKC